MFTLPLYKTQTIRRISVEERYESFRRLIDALTRSLTRQTAAKLCLCDSLLHLIIP